MDMCLLGISDMASFNLWPQKTLGILVLCACSQACSQTGQKATPSIVADATKSQPNTTNLSPTDAELKHRFRGIRGGERVIDGLVQMNHVALHNEKGYVVDYGGYGPKGRSHSGYGGDDFVVPKTLRMMHFGVGSQVKNSTEPPIYMGDLLADVTVEVASRFPADLLDEVRRRGGGLRFKIRVHPSGPLIGWDIFREIPYEERRRSFAAGIPAESYDMAGGDFREAYIFNGTPIRKGWYIDKKTGQKVETDF
jgi:hypothetical protein